MDETQERYLTASDVAAWLRLPKGTVYVLARKGVLPNFKLGKAIRFRQSELTEALRALGRGAPVAPVAEAQ